MTAFPTITLTAISVLMLSFIIMISFTNSFSNEIKTNQNEFYHQIFPEGEKKIYIIGSSQVGHLNETYIQETYLDPNPNYKIYNLARGSDTPNSRLQFTDDIIHSKPQIVLYGVGYRDFSEVIYKNKITEHVKPLLPDPSSYFTEIITTTNNFLGIDSDSLKSPQIIMRYLIHDLLRDENDKFKTTEIFATSTKPFYSYNEAQKRIMSDYGLKMRIEENQFKLEPIEPLDKNHQIITLRQILTKLKENHIQVVVFTTPHSKYYINSLEESDKRDFDSLLKSISDDLTIPVYRLNDKYHDENIWYDNEHIVLGGAEITYNHDIGKIIQQEIKR